ncbi:MAG: hypothetical protein JXQ30_07550 [Spirochaetes bacterium]|nr:hypothetical protein [Spirochaetota bacterium]
MVSLYFRLLNIAYFESEKRRRNGGDETVPFEENKPVGTNPAPAERAGFHEWNDTSSVGTEKEKYPLPAIRRHRGALTASDDQGGPPPYAGTLLSS